MIKNILHIILIFLVMVLALFGAGYLAFRVFLPPQKIQKMAIDGIRGTVYREARFGSLSVAPFSGIVIDDFALSEMPDFSAGTFMTVKKVVFRLHLLPLLVRSMTARELTIDSPSVHLSAAPRGRVKAGSRSSRDGNDLRGAPAVLRIGRCAIRNGEISFPLGGRTLRLSAVNISAREVSTLESFPCELAGRLSDGRQAVDIAVKAEIDIPTWTITLRESVFSARGKSLRCAGEVHQFHDPASISYNGTIEGDAEILDRILELLPIPPMQYGTDPVISLSFSGQGDNLTVTNRGR